jgi:hypothetical protein
VSGASLMPGFPSASSLELDSTFIPCADNPDFVTTHLASFNFQIRDSTLHWER